MKRILFTLLLLLFFNLFYGQGISEGATFSGVARDNSGQLLFNASINVRLSYLSNINPLVVQYKEVHQAVSTNFLGEFFTVAGQGTQTEGLASSFITIPWNSGPIYLKVEIDYGAGYVDMGSVRLWSSYYAFASKTAESIAIAGQEGQILTYNNGQWAATNSSQISYDGSTGTVNLTNNGGSYTNPSSQAIGAYSETTLTATQRNTWVEDASMQLTVPATGTYMIVASGRIWGLQTGEYGTFRLYNATTQTVIGQAVINSGGNDATGSFSRLLALNANDVIKIEFRALPAGPNNQPFSYSGNNEGASSFTLVRVK